MKLCVKTMKTYFVFEENELSLKNAVYNQVDSDLSVYEDGYNFNSLYKRGIWDGKVHFLDKENNNFPTGFLDDVIDSIGKLQSSIPFQYTVDYEKPDRFLTIDDMDEKIELADEQSSITLRDYQYNAVHAVIDQEVGIVNVSTNGGKCLVGDSLLQTSKGLISIKDLIKKYHLVPDANGYMKNTTGLQIVNRYDKFEDFSHITLNGKREVRRVELEGGYSVTVTLNHPLLVHKNDGSFEWKEAKDITLADKVCLNISQLSANPYYAMPLSQEELTDAHSHAILTQDEVPSQVLQQSYAYQLAYVKMLGILRPSYAQHKDILAYHTNPHVIKQLQILCASLGYVTKIAKENYLVNVVDRSKSKGQFYVAKVVQTVNEPPTMTYDLHVPETHSFTVNGIISHNTEIASGFIQQLLPYLEKGETVGFFTHSKQIFNQSAERLSKRLGIKVGKVGGGKMDVQQVNVVMIPTVNNAVKSDPEAGLKLTAKERQLKRLAKEVAPNFVDGLNQRQALENYIQNMVVKTKTDNVLKEELKRLLGAYSTDSQLRLHMKSLQASYIQLIKGKNGKVYKKKEDITKFLKSVTVMIVDEAHHTSSDSWYNSLLMCENAQYRMALTGSIDRANPVLWNRMRGLFHDVVIKVSNKELIARGISAKPKIAMIPITYPTEVQYCQKYLEAYTKGIVQNEYRNTVISKLVKSRYDKGDGVLIIVSWKEHGELLSELLKAEKIPHEFMYSDIEDKQREQFLSDMRSGKLKVMIATSLMDEGIDISGIDTLILSAGGKSFRQALQRVGRVLRKKSGENVAHVFDFKDLTNKFLKDHYKQRLKIYTEEEFEVIDIKQ